MSEQSLFPVVRARDPRALISWIEETLGGELLELNEGAEGSVAHAEVRVGDGVVMLGQEGGELSQPAGSFQVYVAVDEVDSRYERAVDADAEVVRAPFDTEYGSRDFTVRDPEGGLWSFGTYRPED